MPPRPISGDPQPRSLRSLPKAHLHVHFEAAVPRDLLAEAVGGGTELPPTDPGDGFDGFARSFLAMIDLFSRPGMFDVAFDAIARDAADEGVVYVEVGVSPHFYAPAYGSPEAALEAMIQASDHASRTHGVEIGLMLTIDRTFPVADAASLVDLAIAYRDRGVVSIGAANDERDHPLVPFAEPLGRAAAAGLAITPHAGELVGADSVREALTLGATRIQHGVRAVEDADLVTRLAAGDVCLDVCPTSNVLLGIVPTMAQHPLAHLVRAGVPCTINADDPTILGVSILDEYETARTGLGLTDDELASCARTSIRFSHLTDPAKRRALDDIDAWLNSETKAP